MGLMSTLLIISLTMQHKCLFSLAEKQEKDASHPTSVKAPGEQQLLSVLCSVPPHSCDDDTEFLAMIMYGE